MKHRTGTTQHYLLSSMNHQTSHLEDTENEVKEESIKSSIIGTT